MDGQTTRAGKPRQRSSVACNVCRSKRIKCDGNRPSCTSCCVAGLECEYSSREGNRKPPSKRYVEALQERIKSLEQQLKQVRTELTANDDGDAGDDSPSESESESPSRDASSSHRSPMQDLSDRLGRLNVGEDGQVRYFGSRSNFSLLRSRMTDNTSVSASALQQRASQTIKQLNLEVIVSEELRDHLLDVFWSWQNAWQYIVVKDMFIQDLNNPSGGQYASPLLLSAILALSARYSDRPELRTDPSDPNTAGDALAEQAKMGLFYETQAPTITTVQAALLLSLRETATDKESLGWLYCGMATRMAFNLGLHLNCKRWCETGHVTKEAVEVRNVVWWGCYVLDKLYNIGLGRPSTIQEHEVTAPFPTAQHSPEFGAWSADPVVEGPRLLVPASSIISNVQATCQLLKIAASALDEVYRPRTHRIKSRIIDLVAKTHVKMMEFYTHLPSCLRLPTLASQPALPHVYQLHLQYHVAMILLHRPFVALRKNSQGSKPTEPEMAALHLKECSQSAQSIANIFKAYRKHFTLRRIPISAVHCAFTASTITLVEAMSQDLADRRRTVGSLEILATALHEMSVAWAWSRRALVAIRQLAREWSVGDDIRGALDVKSSLSVESQNGGMLFEDGDSTLAMDLGIPPWFLDDLGTATDSMLPFSLFDGLEQPQWTDAGLSIDQEMFASNPNLFDQP